MTTLANTTCGNAPGICCPAKFDGGDTGLPSCERGEIRSTRICGDARKLSRYWSIYSMECYYDLTTGTLIGAVRTYDTATFCDRTSHDETAGKTPSCDTPSSENSCVSDAGASDG